MAVEQSSDSGVRPCGRRWRFFPRRDGRLARQERVAHGIHGISARPASLPQNSPSSRHRKRSAEAPSFRFACRAKATAGTLRPTGGGGSDRRLARAGYFPSGRRSAIQLISGCLSIRAAIFGRPLAPIPEFSRRPFLCFDYFGNTFGLRDQTYNCKRGKISAPARPEVDGHRVRRGVRARFAVAVCAARICPHGLRRSPAEPYYC